MKTPRIFIAYAPRGAGLRCAVGYLTDRRNVYGWFTGPADGRWVSDYFLLERFYSGAGTRFLATSSQDLHRGWTSDHTEGRAEPIGPERIDEPLCHELAQLQEALVAEWLFGHDDAVAADELARYAEAELAAGGALNVRFRRLNRMSTLQPTWTFYSPEFEHSVARYLMRRWPLEYGGEEAMAA